MTTPHPQRADWRPNFQAWMDEADMPAKRPDGSWYDMETGLAYDPRVNYASHRPRAPLSNRVVEARAVAKLYGGKALKGTAKQKEWAEKIRAEKLSAMTEDQAEMAADPTGLLTSAKFWIENRQKRAGEIVEFVQEQKALLKLAAQLQAQGKAKEYAEVAAKYNALTTEWGWEG